MGGYSSRRTSLAPSSRGEDRFAAAERLTGVDRLTGAARVTGAARLTGAERLTGVARLTGALLARVVVWERFAAAGAVFFFFIALSFVIVFAEINLR
jgi:hypothetical protein